MSSAQDKFLKDMESVLPPMCSVNDLVNATGIKDSTWCTWRYRGIGPQFLKLGGVVRYPRAAVLDWMKSQLRDGTL